MMQLLNGGEAEGEETTRYFRRAIALPIDADMSDVVASLDHGVLCVRVRRIPPPTWGAEVRSVPIYQGIEEVAAAEAVAGSARVPLPPPLAPEGEAESRGNQYS